MAFPLFLAFFVLLSPLLLVPSDSEQQENGIQITCPNSFDCKKFRPLNFPLSNSTQYSQCGLCTVLCDEPIPIIQLGNVHYEVRNISQADDASPVKIQIHDPELQKQLVQTKCDAFYPNIRFPNSSAISFKMLNDGITLFKCNKSSSDPSNGFHKLMTVCQDFDLYYKEENQKDQPSAPADPNCSEIQLPMKSPGLNPYRSDPFLLISADFTVELHVTKQCLDCHLRGGQCRDHNQKFDCTAKKGGKMFLILGVAVGIGGFVLLLSCCLARHLALGKSIVFWKNETEDYRNIEAFLKNCGSLSPKRYTYSDIKKMTDSFRIKLGQGGYGCVFKGKLENGSLVAVKVLKGLKGSGEDFVNEVATISRTSHVNIVTLLGFCFEGGNKALIYKFMPKGSLDKFIHDRNSSTYRQLGWDSLYKIAVGIAQGLEYLHRGCNTRILHFDIKPHNILLDEDFCPKISDFGLAKLCPQKESIVSLLGARGTAGYIAPEVFSRNFGEVSHKSDVYSYGMMVLEMVGGRKNISVEVDRTSEIYFPHWIYKRLELDEELGLHGIVDEEANGSVRKMAIVGLWCIQTDPSHRPSMGKVVEMLEGSLESLQIPPKPFLSSPSRSPADSSTTIVVT